MLAVGQPWSKVTLTGANCGRLDFTRMTAACAEALSVYHHDYNCYTKPVTATLYRDHVPHD